jgi:hypothetical protein
MCVNVWERLIQERKQQELQLRRSRVAAASVISGAAGCFRDGAGLLVVCRYQAWRETAWKLLN